MTDTSPSDEACIARFQTGEEEAFELLFERYHRHLINFAYRFLGSPEEAEDVAQDVLLRIYWKKNQFDPRWKFRPWIFSIASHLISNKRRDQKRHPHQSLIETGGEEDHAFAEIPDPHAPDAHAELEKREIVRAVQSALSLLPDNQRIAVILARFEEMSYEEIASTMNLSLDAVTSLLFRGRQTLKKALGASAK